MSRSRDSGDGHGQFLLKNVSCSLSKTHYFYTAPHRYGDTSFHIALDIIIINPAHRTIGSHFHGTTVIFKVIGYFNLGYLVHSDIRECDEHL